MMYAKKIKAGLFALVLLVMIFPFIQESLNVFQIKKLSGAIEKSSMPEFSIKSFKTLEFQPKFENYQNEQIGFRNLLIRLHNQIQFSLFREATAKMAVVGKQDYLYEENYIKEYLGRLFIGKKEATIRFNKLKFIQDELKKRNVDLVLIFSPGKASFYPQYIPDRFKPEIKTTSNYDFFKILCARDSINLIDFNQYFQKIKDTVSWPIYPKCDIHWSIYGMTLCADSIFKYIGAIRNINMTRFGWNGVEISDTLRDTDNDLADGLNLLFGIPVKPGAYPRFSFKESPNDAKPNVLVIADSFYWSIFGNGLPSRVFGENDFWYYYKQANDKHAKTSDVANIDKKKAFESHDVIILMGAETNLHWFPYGFIEDAYKIYFPNDETNIKSLFRNFIQKDQQWTDSLQRVAHQQNCQLETMIEKELQKVTNRLKGSVDEKEINETIQGIRADKKWLAIEEAKARDQKISLNEMLRKDALWILQNNDQSFINKYWPR